MKTYIFTFIVLLFIFNEGIAQRISGRNSLNTLNMEESVVSKKMTYGNVEVFDMDNNLVASVITDEYGNYDLKLRDTGTYRLKIMYAGYKTNEKTIVVKDDVVSNISLDRDKDKKERVVKEKEYALETRYMDGLLSVSESEVKKGKTGNGLTSGEINDFSKWELWNDYLKDDLLVHQRLWKINPQQRYVVQLINEAKNPLVGARVQLYSKTNEILWETISDNTGKAELWGTINSKVTEIGKIKVTYKDVKKEIKRPKAFKKGINTLRLNVDCEVSNLVEIAFLVDATGSMGDEINFIKRDLNKVMFKAQNLYDDVSIKYASVFYRDKGEEYITKHKDFTNILSEALVFVDEQSAVGGGDTPEALVEGLDVAINELSWSEKTRAKLLFVILDAPAHSEVDKIKQLETLAIKAAKKGIKIIAVTGSGINKSGEYLMRSLALCSNGTYVFLTNHSGIGGEHIEPTTDEYDVKLLNERMTSIIKANLFYPECENEIPEYEMSYPDSLVEFTLEEGQIYEGEDSLETNIDNDSEKIEWKYYPNPTKDYVYIEASEKIEFVFLTDLTGKILQKVSFNGLGKVSLYLGDYPVGIYLLRYPLGKTWVTGKVVLTR